MEVKQRLVIDLAYPGAVQVAYAVQGDSGTRALDIELRANQAPWAIPEVTAVMVHYQRRSDGGGGTYDTLPDGTWAWQISGNVLTVLLAPQVCGINGDVAMELTLLQGEKQLTTFRFIVRVSGSIGEPEENGDYTNLSTWLEANIGPARDAAAGSAAAAEQAKADAEEAAKKAAKSEGTVTDLETKANKAKEAAELAAQDAKKAKEKTDQNVDAVNQAKAEAETSAVNAKIFAGAAAGSAAEAEKIKEEMVSLMDKTIIRDTMSGPIVQRRFIEGTSLDYTIRMEATQEGEGDPSPENVRAIVGADSVEVTVCGKNLFKNQAFKTDGFEGNADGIITALSGRDSIIVNVEFKANVVYTFCFERVSGTGHLPCIIVRNRDGSTAGQKTNWGNINAPLVISFPYDCKKTLHFQGESAVGNITTGDRYRFQAVIGTVATAYEPYIGTTHTIQLPETCYVGYIDWNRKKYVQTQGVAVLDGSTPVAVDGDCNFYVTTVLENAVNTKVATLSSHFVSARAGQGLTNNVYISSTRRINIQTDKIEHTAEAFKAFLAAQHATGTPVTVVYKLVQPIEHDLPNIPTLTALDGITTVYSDAKEVEVTGYLTAKDYIDKKIIELTALNLEVRK